MARRRISAYDQEARRLKKFEKGFFGLMWAMFMAVIAGIGLLMVKSVRAIAGLFSHPGKNNSAGEEPTSPSLESFEAAVPSDDFYQPNPMWALVNVSVTNRKEAMVLAPQMLKQAKETADILNSTTNPETFFQRYDFLMGRLEILKECGQYGITFTGEDPSATLAQLSHKSFRNKSSCHMIDRCFDKANEKIASLKTAKGKQNAAERFNESFEPCRPYMSEEMIQHQTHKYNELLAVVSGALASEGKESDAKMPQVPNLEHDPYLERWNNRKAPKIVDLEMPDLPFQSRFDLSHIRGYDFGMEGNPVPFFIDGKNRDIATEDILSLNPFLRQAHDQDRKVPVFAFSADKIRFDSKEPETDDLTMLSTRPLTKTGKLPKYPLMMKIRTLSNDESWNMQTAEGSGGKELFGEIYYLQTGEIGKARIICWRHVRKKEYATSECYTFNIKRNKDGLYLAE